MNTIDNINNGVLVAQRALNGFFTRNPLLSAIAGDFSEEQARLGEKIITAIPSCGAARDYSIANGYEVDDANQEEVEINLSELVHHTISFHDREINSARFKLVERFGDAQGDSVAVRIMGDLFAQVTAANFPAKSVIASGAFDYDACVDLAEALTDAKVGPMGRVMVLAASHYYALAKDATVVANAAAPSDTARSGVLRNIAGFDVFLAPGLPANGQNLAGFVASKDALLYAVRPPIVPDSQLGIESVIEPDSGLTLQSRSWYVPQQGRLYHSLVAMFGVGKGAADSLRRITTA